ncbi:MULTISPECIES: deoxyribose-phosphate aldolase [unclassified Clostridioides]|uniref:deoxyribose-phosphate aldolase n=1 Tax=unclassified Clostridioides TaxID=2635829 RepID=UPI001D0C9C06|nr:deoxyribose-phosphate aldolase [Clostridioides sp. ES-S-0001-02]MCC0651998.1 deoxyribose-phosphate aldolase [Clostridioides sp. ES-S-0001-03]MCC0657803.1 deoxyribose-phosphate aldolase [Clostridioides sp. ES-S-0123-01]MCC0673344.1 deoxyribose-phosphate aldolase [Clostridioides sp. ES-S-0145-01]MCC0679079.1 deoxyribose-phosphate aldolase [Clostridioides sp. ES-S-0005-03]MCC0703566.1 deoxyribose-phosphate aldolase [Clostridioides sp. ES-S-0049-02]UDN48885.1 deoxyribose-phosphate aldolase [Cl
MKHILKTVDHTILKATTTWEDIKILCDEAINMNVASVCIPPSYVKRAVEYLNSKIKVCTVIGFPLGYQTTATKVFEAEDAIKNGADEVDMVVNISDIKNGDYEKIENEIKEIKAIIGDKILKVIIETCYLEEYEKVKMCEIVTVSGADFIKTSTGMGTGGATLEDIKLMKEHVGETVKIKAAGGVKSISDAEKFIEAGAERLGTSSICKILKNEDITGY